MPVIMVSMEPRAWDGPSAMLEAGMELQAPTAFPQRVAEPPDASTQCIRHQRMTAPARAHLAAPAPSTPSHLHPALNTVPPSSEHSTTATPASLGAPTHPHTAGPLLGAGRNACTKLPARGNGAICVHAHTKAEPGSELPAALLCQLCSALSTTALSPLSLPSCWHKHSTTKSTPEADNTIKPNPWHHTPWP